MAIAETRVVRTTATTDSRLRRGPLRWFVLAGTAVLALLILAPFVLLALNAFKSPADYSLNGPLSLPEAFYADGLRNFWTSVNYPEKLLNSFVIAAVVAVVAVAVSLMTAYALGIGRIRGRMVILGVLLLANIVPQESLVYPLYFISKQVGIYNTQLAVIIIFIAIRAAFGTYLLASTFSVFPRAVLEAGEIDGASRWQVLRHIVYPMSRPTLSVLLIFFFIWTWNEFFIPLIMLITNSTQTIPVALASLQGDRHVDVPTINAGSLISLLPALLFFLIFQRSLMRGISAGAVK